jgi:hypothetical protein
MAENSLALSRLNVTAINSVITANSATRRIEGIPWPVAYGGFIAGAAMIDCATLLVLRYVEAGKI